tara:strand:+ start:825 stop:1310 length:486 start_codon:yes stop_codon:yes gene_type:complete
MSFKISCLLFAKDVDSKLLLIKRKKSPNKGLWSPPGGKLEMESGESPFECAKREAHEEMKLNLDDHDLHLFGYVSEKNYEGGNHWLMFLFEILPNLTTIPDEINEGHFKFFARNEIETLEIPPSDHKLVWPIFDKRTEGFWGIRANFDNMSTKIKIEAEPK